MTWMPVAKKEYVENVRNAWILAVGGLFLVLTLSMSAFANLRVGEEGLGGIAATILAMAGFVDFILPILALMLAFGTLAGERESGSLGLLVAQPLSRADILLGKALGLYGVLASALVAGVGVGGLLILARTGGDAEAFRVLVVFLLETLAWGAAWISVALLISAFFDRRGTAIGASIVAWFVFGVVWSILVLVVLFAAAGPGVFQGDFEAPRWLILLYVLNPNSVYDGLLVTTMPGFQSLGGSLGQAFLGDTFQPALFVAAMAAWIALPYWGAYALFHRKDV